MALILFSCAASDEGLEIKIASNTRVDFAELSLNTTSMILDSLRTDNEPFVVVGNYQDDFLGHIDATAYVQFAFESGATILKSFNFDSLIFTIKRDQTLSNGTPIRDELLFFPLKEKLYSDVVYLSSFEVEKDPLPIDTLIVNLVDDRTRIRQFAFGEYLFDILRQDSSIIGFTSEFALAPLDQTTSLVTLDLSSDSTFFTIYMSDDSLNNFVSNFVFTGTHFSQLKRDRSTSVFGVPNDLDTVNISDEFTIINPLFGVTTLVDLQPLMDFVKNTSDIIINRAEIETSIEISTENPLDQIRYYFFNQNSGIRGEGIFNDPSNTLVLSNEAYLQTRNLILLGSVDSINYVNDITLFTEIYINKFIDEGDFLTEKLVLTGNRFIDLQETRVESDNIKLRIYYTSIK